MRTLMIAGALALAGVALCGCASTGKLAAAQAAARAVHDAYCDGVTEGARVAMATVVTGRPETVIRCDRDSTGAGPADAMPAVVVVPAAGAPAAP